jgi:putative transposase
MKRRFSEEQIVRILGEAESGAAITELCRKHNISDATFYTWRKKYRGMSGPDVRELKALREENQRLKKLLAEAMLDNAALKEVVSRKW